MSVGTHEGRTDPGAVQLIRVPTLLLDERGGDPDDSLHRRPHVVVQADTVKVRGRIRLPGKTLEILTRRIESEEGVIDVSGAEAATSYDPAAPDPTLNGTEGRPRGGDGKAGDRGNDGGTLRIQAHEIAGKLELRASGSAGGNGQRAGDGHQPAPGRTGENGTFSRHDPPVGKFGAHELFHDYERYWAGGDVITVKKVCELADGQPGGDAAPGGDAGRPGRGGDGGNGGTIQVVRVAGSADFPPELIAEGGAPGAPGGAANPGPPGKPGLGGLNQIFRETRGSNWYRYADDSSKEVADIVHRCSVATRNRSGASCDRSGAVPPPPEPATPGRKGTVECGGLTEREFEEFVEGCDPAYVQFVRDCAASEAAHGRELLDDAADPADWAAAQRVLSHAIDGYSWLVLLTYKGRGPRGDLNREATMQVAELWDLTRRPSPFAPPAPSPGAEAAAP